MTWSSDRRQGRLELHAAGIDFVEGAAISTIKFLFSLVFVIVVSIYML